MYVSELFDICRSVAEAGCSARSWRQLHELLVVVCAEGLKGSGVAYGSLFAQVDALCHRCHVEERHRFAIQQLRLHSNRAEPVGRAAFLADVSALALFVSAVFGEAIPASLLSVVPHPSTLMPPQAVRKRSFRCIVDRWTADAVDVHTDDALYRLSLSGRDYLPPLLRQGMQLNVLEAVADEDTGLLLPRVVVVEPDFLVDISSVAACFGDYGHHPFSYTVQRMRPRQNTQPMLLGNFAGAALDDLINRPSATFADTLSASFRRQALQFCTCEEFDAARFKADALQQAANLRQTVDVLFAPGGFDRSKALLEPSFVCEQLGLQGRVDLMTSDLRLLVEQKSGKMHQPTEHQFRYREGHYVQLLLYYGILRYNFGRTGRSADIRLLYSKYPPAEGLVVVNYYHQLFARAIRLRNELVAQELDIARNGFATVMPRLGLKGLSAAEQRYLDQMMTFVYREQVVSKMGRQEGQGGGAADLWNMPLGEKLATGNIILGAMPDLEASTPAELHLVMPAAGGEELSPLNGDGTAGGDGSAQPVLNFRRGDMVYLYRYRGEPRATESILYKGALRQLDSRRAVVQLFNPQQNLDLLAGGPFAVEHADSDIGTNSQMRSLCLLMRADADRRQLLLGRRAPRADASRRLSRAYHPDYDGVVLAQRQALDYYLLQGPPGTGKTSMALRFMVDEELAAGGQVLLTAYTNRAVDEICAMLTDSGTPYLRLGSESSCDSRYADRLLDRLIGARPRLDQVRRLVAQTPVVAATSSTLQSRMDILELKRFSLCIVDEASQILEPSIVGILAHPNIGRFVLVGDHKQLPAVVQQDDDRPELSWCRQSLFERLLRQERAAGRTAFTGLLRRQGRMHPDIAAFPNQMFYARERLQPVPLPHQQEHGLAYGLPSLDALDDLLRQRRVWFHPHDASADHAAWVATVLRRIRRFAGPAFDARLTVGVIVTYRSQIAAIRNAIERQTAAAEGNSQAAGSDAAAERSELLSVSVDTVERYQGSQRDVIICDFGIEHFYQLAFLTANTFVEDGRTIDRKLNVAMTRARRQLIMTGRADLLGRNPLYAQLIKQYSENT